MLDIKPHAAGDPISVAEYNLILAELRRLGRLSVVGYGELDDTAGGMCVHVRSTDRTCIVKITSAATKGGVYNGVRLLPPTTLVDASGSLTMPEGETVITNPALIENLAENGSSGHVLPVSGTGIYHVGISRGYGTGDAEIVAIDAQPTAPRIVNLTKISGSDGTKTAAASWTYDLYQRKADGSNGDKLNTGDPLSPLKPRPYGTAAYATAGLAYIDPAGDWQLAEAYEVEGSGGCP